MIAGSFVTQYRIPHCYEDWHSAFSSVPRAKLVFHPIFFSPRLSLFCSSSTDFDHILLSFQSTVVDIVQFVWQPTAWWNSRHIYELPFWSNILLINTARTFDIRFPFSTFCISNTFLRYFNCDVYTCAIFERRWKQNPENTRQKMTKWSSQRFDPTKNTFSIYWSFVQSQKPWQFA